MIEFQCQHCGRKFKAKDNYAGKKGKCPDCHVIIVIPEIKKEQLLFDIAEDNQTVTNQFLKASHEQEQIRLNQHNQSIIEHQNEPEDKRKLPWFLDVLLYPTSLAGIINITIFTALPLIMFLASAILGPLALVINLIIVAVGLYYYWYLTECVRDSAAGETRASVLSVQSVDFKDVFFSNLTILACGIFFIGPVVVYANYFIQFDYIFWLLAAYSFIFSPMAFLAVVLYDSVSVFNPFFLVGSIISTFINYCQLLLMLAFIGVLMWLIDFKSSFLMGLPASFLKMYLVMVCTNLLGRFFVKNEEKLGWEV